MFRSIHTSHALWISGVFLFVFGCTNRAPSLRMLDSRAGYGAEPDDAEVALYQKGRRNQESLLNRSAPRVAQVYIYPHELPTRDYFWGGYVSLVVSKDEWIFENPDDRVGDPSSEAAFKETKKTKGRKLKSPINPKSPKLLPPEATP